MTAIMRPRTLIALVPVILAPLLSARSLSAQTILKSPPGSVTQMVGHTKIEVAYHRPVARGRVIFGALVPWGNVWSPSSDTAAVISFSTAVRIEGKPLPAGSYSLWAIPDRERWTMIFSSNHPTFHLRYPAGADALRVDVHPRTAEHMETLGLYFPMVDADSSTFVLHWGTTVVPISIRSDAPAAPGWIPPPLR